MTKSNCLRDNSYGRKRGRDKSNTATYVCEKTILFHLMSVRAEKTSFRKRKGLVLHSPSFSLSHPLHSALLCQNCFSRRVFPTPSASTFPRPVLYTAVHSASLARPPSRRTFFFSGRRCPNKTCRRDAVRHFVVPFIRRREGFLRKWEGDKRVLCLSSRSMV